MSVSCVLCTYKMYSKVTLSINEDVIGPCFRHPHTYGKLIKEPVVLVYLIYIQVCNIMMWKKKVQHAC